MIDLSIIILGIAIIAATVTDIRKREVPDWLSYSLIITAVITATAKSVIYTDYQFIANSLSGLAIFWIIANLFYYSKLFAGGDAKLLVGVGASLGISLSFLINILIIGGLYGLIYSIALAAINFKNVKDEMRHTKLKISPFVLLAAIFLIAGIISNLFILYFVSALAIISPMLYIFVFAVEKAALIKNVHASKLTEGDWLAKDVKIGNKTVKARFEGLSKEEIRAIKKAGKTVKIKYGLPFVPVFLIAFIFELSIGNLIFLLIRQVF